MALPAKGYYSVLDAVGLIHQRTGELLTDRHLLEYAADEKIEIGAFFERIRIWPEESNAETIELQNHYVSLPINHVLVTALMKGTASFDVCRYQGRAFRFHGRRSAPTTSLDFSLRRVDLSRNDLVIPYSSLERLIPPVTTELPKKAGDTLDSRERKSLLKIIAVLAGEAKIDLAKHHAAGEVVAKGATLAGFTLDAKTAAGHLQTARDLPKDKV